MLASIIFYFSLLALICPVVLCLVVYRKTVQGFKVLSWYLIFVFLLNTTSLIMRNLSMINLPLLHCYTIIEFIFIFLFYYYILNGIIKKWMLILLSILFLAFGLLNAIYIQDWYQFNTLPRSIESLVIIILCISCYYNMLSQLKTMSLFKDPVFWVNTGFLIYFSCSLFLFMMSNYILPLNSKLNVVVWIIHALFCDLLYLFISIGLWKIKKT
jgi:hypothetical protein